MKEYAIVGVVITLLASVLFGEIYSGVATAITEIAAVIERAVPHP